MAEAVKPADVVTMDRVVAATLPTSRCLRQRCAAAGVSGVLLPARPVVCAGRRAATDLSRALFRIRSGFSCIRCEAWRPLLERHGLVRLRRHETLKNGRLICTSERTPCDPAERCLTCGGLCERIPDCTRREPLPCGFSFR